MTEPTDEQLAALRTEFGITSNGRGIKEYTQVRDFARAVLAKCGAAAPVVAAGYALVPVEPTPEMLSEIWVHKNGSLSEAYSAMLAAAPQPTQAQAGAVPLTDREIELIDGMIQVQLDHASRCDAIANRSMADKQKGWDMERVALLQKFKAHGIKGGQHGAE